MFKKFHNQRKIVYFAVLACFFRLSNPLSEKIRNGLNPPPPLSEKNQKFADPPSPLVRKNQKLADSAPHWWLK